MVIRSRMRQAVYVARMEKKIKAYNVSMGKHEEKNSFECLGADGTIIL